MTDAPTDNYSRRTFSAKSGPGPWLALNIIEPNTLELVNADDEHLMTHHKGCYTIVHSSVVQFSPAELALKLAPTELHEQIKEFFRPKKPHTYPLDFVAALQALLRGKTVARLDQADAFDVRELEYKLQGEDIVYRRTGKSFTRNSYFGTIDHTTSMYRIV